MVLMERRLKTVRWISTQLRAVPKKEMSEESIDENIGLTLAEAKMKDPVEGRQIRYFNFTIA